MLMNMATADNFMATDIKWDPTGRYTYLKHHSLRYNYDGFYIWSLMGSCFTEHSRNKSFRAKGKRGEKRSAAVHGEVRGRRRRSVGFVKQTRDGEEKSNGRRMGDVDKQVETAA
ncbi:unnamed protein product [Brassica rapa]|uniref:Translation initiation factor beta propellor-like domain-containing protein n=2 Tax=Brassica TaxID=3705 RepID=A0A8D9GQB5_BRACM|nr:unnamed protein product [Brassica napus]CAG7884870.1 unnamed protein product [Brassica rapa]CDY13452.1 BnaA03g51700D [Brassica napus]